MILIRLKKMCEFIKLMNCEVCITYSQNRCPNIDITDTNAFILFSKLSYIPCTCTKFYYNYNGRCFGVELLPEHARLGSSFSD